MKKIVLMSFFISFLTADVLNIITQIKQMENYTPKIKKIPSYNIFINTAGTKKNSVAAVVKKSSLVLNAIFQNKANINGIWVKKGENIQGYTVVRINDNGVVLKKDGKYKKLLLNPKILKVIK